MHYNPAFAHVYETMWNAEERFEREAEIQEKIHRCLSRFNEKELQMVLDYALKVYAVSDAYKYDKMWAEAQKQKTT